MNSYNVSKVIARRVGYRVLVALIDSGHPDKGSKFTLLDPHGNRVMLGAGELGFGFETSEDAAWMQAPLMSAASNAIRYLEYAAELIETATPVAIFFSPKKPKDRRWRVSIFVPGHRLIVQSAKTIEEAIQKALLHLGGPK